MLFTLVKALVFLAVVVGLAFGVDYLLGVGSIGLLQIFGREFALTPLLLVVAALVLLVAVWLVFKLVGLVFATVRFLNGDETAISRYFDRRSERKGYEALTDGLMALAAGEGRLAMRKADRAEGYLRQPGVTHLLTAQAAEMIGDTARATESYKALVQDPRTRFVGVRGLMKQKLDAGDTDTALKLAQKAFAIRPRNEEVQDTLLSLQARGADWSGARETLNAKLRAGSLPRDVHRRRDAVLALAAALKAEQDGNAAAARAEALEANRLSPDLVPAAAIAARMQAADGSARAATRTIRKAWEAQPHPDLAAAFATLAPQETPAARIRRFRPLVTRHPDHPESRMLNAELHIAAEDFPAARRALGDLATARPDARSLTIMAAIERGEGAEDRVVRGWLAKAVTASRGPQWTCTRCGHVHGAWRPICENCHSFDSLAWQEAPQSSAALTGPAQMLPLVVGALERPAPQPGDAGDDAPDADRGKDIIDATDLDDDLDARSGAATEGAEAEPTGPAESGARP